MPPPNVLMAIGVLVIGVPLNVMVVFLLARVSLGTPGSKVLRERLVAALLVLVLTVVFGLIFFNNDTVPPYIETEATKLITRAALLAVAVIPACWWLYLYFKGDR